MRLPQKSDLFKNVSPEEFKILNPLARQETFASGSIIFNQEAPADKIYLLDHGSVAIKTSFSDGLEITYEIITRKGDPFGLSALIAPFRFTTTAICLEKTGVLAFPQKNLMQAFSRHPALGYKVMQNLSILMARRLKRTRQILAGQI